MNTTHRFKKLDKKEKEALLSKLISQAESLNNNNAENRKAMTALFDGKAPVPKSDRVGRSKVITRECNETAGWLEGLITLPLDKDANLFNVMPAKEGDEEVIDVAGNMLSHVAQKQNEPVDYFGTWFKTGVIWGVGVLMLNIEEKIQVEFERIRNLTSTDVETLLADPDVREISRKEVISEVEVERNSTEADRLPDEKNKEKKRISTFDIRIRRTHRSRRFTIDPLPNEEFLISDMSASIDKNRLIGRRYTTTRSELLMMNLDVEDSVIEQLPSSDELNDNEEFSDRHDDDSASVDPKPDDDDITIFQIYVIKDFDGDGIAELTKFICARKKTGASIVAGTEKGAETEVGIEILHEEEVPEHPFIGWHPIPFPHKFFSNGVVELMEQIQTVKTEMTRATLDTAYLTANPRRIINRNVNVDDVLQTRLDHPIRVKSLTSVQDAIKTDLTPFDASLISLLEHFDQNGEMLTGVSKRTMGLDPSLLQNVTATATNQAVSAGQAKIQLVGTQFRRSIKELGRKLLRFIIRYQDKDEQLKINGRWVPITTASWNIGMSVNLTVGPLGGSKAEAMNFYNSVVNAQESIIGRLGLNNPFVKPRQYYNALSKFIEAGGTEDVNMFFTRPPEQIEQPKPTPDPKLVLVQGELKLAQDKQNSELQIKAQESNVKNQLAQAKLQAELQIKAEESQKKILIEFEKMLREQGLKSNEIAAKVQMKQQELQAEFQVKISELTAEIKLKDAELSFQSALAAKGSEDKANIEQAKVNIDTRLKNPNTP